MEWNELSKIVDLIIKLIDSRSNIEGWTPLFFMAAAMKDFLNKFFDLCREYQQEIPPQKMAEILREYADRLDEW